jgi:tRNA/rRNA methyltransferase
LRRNPTDAERLLWDALVKDRRFAAHRFKRQVPVGPYINDFVSFPLRAVIDLVPGEESEAGAKARAARRAWLEERGYRYVGVPAPALAADLPALLDRVAKSLRLEMPRRPAPSARGGDL